MRSHNYYALIHYLNYTQFYPPLGPLAHNRGGQRVACHHLGVLIDEQLGNLNLGGSVIGVGLSILGD